MGLVPGVFTDNNIHDQTLYKLTPLTQTYNDLINRRTQVSGPSPREVRMLHSLEPDFPMRQWLMLSKSVKVTMRVNCLMNVKKVKLSL
jgi:hypothetical protein